MQRAARQALALWRRWQQRFRAKLLLGLAAILVATLLIAAIAIRNQFRAGQVIQQLIAAEQAQAQLDLELVGAVQGMRRLDQEFRIQYSAADNVAPALQAYVEPWKVELIEVRARLGQSADAGSVVAGVGDRSALLADLTLYEDAFLETSDELNARQRRLRGVSDFTQLDSALERLQIAELQTEALLLRGHANRYLLGPAAVHVDNFNNQAARLRSLFNADPRLSNDDRQRLNLLLDAYLSGFGNLVELDSQIALDTVAYLRAADSVEQRLARELADRNAQLAALEAQLDSINRGTTRAILPLLLLTQLGGAAYAVRLARSSGRQVEQLNRAAVQVANGDFSARAPVSTEDELGVAAAGFNRLIDDTVNLLQSREDKAQLQAAIMQLIEEVSQVAEGDLSTTAEIKPGITAAIADSFNLVVTDLRLLVGNIQQTTDAVGTAAVRLQSTAQRLAHGSEQQANQIIDTANAVNLMSRSIVQASRDAQRAGDVVRRANQRAESGRHSVAAMLAGMQRIGAQVQQAATTVDELSTQATAIDQIVSTIDDIADRTSVLALNATIRALAADDAGRGFAVVAREVESLAAQTAAATARAAAFVGEVQRSARQASAMMGAGEPALAQARQSADAADSRLGQIAAQSQRIVALIGDITQATAQQAGSAGDVARTMNQIADVTRQTAAGSQQANETAGQLTGLTEQLRAAVTVFRLNKPLAAD